MSDIRNDEVGLFLARELETILSRSFEVEYADIKYSSGAAHFDGSFVGIRLLYLPHL